MQKKRTKSLPSFCYLFPEEDPIRRHLAGEPFRLKINKNSALTGALSGLIENESTPREISSLFTVALRRICNFTQVDRAPDRVDGGRRIELPKLLE